MNLGLQDVLSIAYEFVFTPIQVTPAMVGGGVIVLVILGLVLTKWSRNDEMEELVPKYGRKMARQIIKIRRQRPVVKDVPFEHNEPWD
ncbi:hypothetical protein [Achromobacter xylosoxidans]|jgi:hypothetical protein|uniref:hypothetical protein n=1 Tax=Alcaligenes xylosoxydans xylosoxydans TaxID=85698 RepID=UPI0006C0E5E0|nr:hypothetical protein [Achromobacter xylosoxidans]CUJ51250.1 Uncharacterised protein [Achromobacter xylosoxidans]